MGRPRAAGGGLKYKYAHSALFENSSEHYDDYEYDLLIAERR